VNNETKKGVVNYINFFQKCKGDGTKSANKEWREYELTPRNSLKHHSCSIAACFDFVR
jgi:hypothetical protein